MNRHLRSTLLCLLTLAVLAGAARYVASGVPDRPPIVATIDIERLFGSLDLLSTEEARVDEVAAGFDGQLGDLRGQIEELQAELENFEEGGEAWLGINRRVEQTISEYRAIEQFGQEVVPVRLDEGGLQVERHGLRVRPGFHLLPDFCVPGLTVACAGREGLNGGCRGHRLGQLLLHLGKDGIELCELLLHGFVEQNKGG